MTNNERLKAVPWAVYLGANTASRLAEEWGTSIQVARYWLAKARRHRLVSVLGNRAGKPAKFRPTRNGMNGRLGLAHAIFALS